MAMVGVDSGSLYRQTHSLSRLALSLVGGRLTPFYVHQMNRVNSRNGSVLPCETQIFAVGSFLRHTVTMITGVSK